MKEDKTIELNYNILYNAWACSNKSTPVYI